MKSKKTHNVVATIGTWTNQDGETKNRYQPCGTAPTNEKGQIGIKLDAFPTAPEWNGWLNLYPVEDNYNSKPREQSPPRQTPSQNFHDQDDIPF